MPDSKVEIIPFRPEFKNHFKELNREWLEKYFTMTVEDEKILDTPEKIIEAGGAVLFVRYENEIVGTCALIPEPDGSFELAKMGVTPKAQGKGIGLKLLEAALDEAKCKGAKIVRLETAVSLTAAIALYHKAGFVKSSGEHVHELFKRVTFQMEKILE